MVAAVLDGGKTTLKSGLLYCSLTLEFAAGERKLGRVSCKEMSTDIWQKETSIEAVRNKAESASKIWMPTDKSNVPLRTRPLLYVFPWNGRISHKSRQRYDHSLVAVATAGDGQVTMQAEIIVIVLRNPLFHAGAGLCRQPSTAKMRCPQNILVTPR